MPHTGWFAGVNPLSLEKSTGEGKLAEGLRDYCAFFAEKTKILG